MRIGVEGFVTRTEVENKTDSNSLRVIRLLKQPPLCTHG
jgi:hypothetical protein